MLYNGLVPPPRRSTAAGTRTRAAVLAAAADLVSVEGLDGLTVGTLASQLGMSKSGLFAHFGSKQDLQLATIEEARQRYMREVISPALGAGPGIARLYALCESFLSYVERAVFPGGCFFASAMAELGAKPASVVRDGITDCQTQWMGTLERAAGDARDRRELRPTSDPAQLAFELEAALISANWYFHLYKDATYLARGRRAIRARLVQEATASGQRALPPPGVRG